MSALAFELPDALEATAPPEARGLTRDAVRLLVADAADGRSTTRAFTDLPDLLDAGDLLVVNMSATLPAAVAARRAMAPSACTSPRGRPSSTTALAWSSCAPPTGRDPSAGARARRSGSPCRAAAPLELVAPYARRRAAVARALRRRGRVEAYLAATASRSATATSRGRWPLAAYQNVYATEPGSAEMPSAGRPFTARLITRAGRARAW